MTEPRRIRGPRTSPLRPLPLPVRRGDGVPSAHAPLALAAAERPRARRSRLGPLAALGPPPRSARGAGPDARALRLLRDAARRAGVAMGPAVRGMLAEAEGLLSLDKAVRIGARGQLRP